MKKLLAIIIAGLLILFCSACGDKAETPADTDHTHSHTHASEEITTAPETNPTTTPATQPQNTFTVLEKGITTPTEYINYSLNLTFDLPDNWTFYPDTELCSLSGLSYEAFSDFDTAIESNPVVYDMYAVYKEQESSVSICFENLELTTGSALTAREYLDFLKNAVEGAGVSQIEDNGTVDFCSGTYESATIISGYDEVKTRKTYFLAEVDNYMVTIIITSKSEITESQIIDMFH